MEKKIVVLGGNADISAAFSGLSGLAVSFAEKPEDVGADAACVVVAEQCADAIAALKQQGIPVAAVTSDAAAETQDRLLDCGADDVLVLPMSAKLLQKRLIALTEQPLHSAEPVDFASFDRVREANKGRGAFIVEEHDFTNVYRFVSRILERLDKKAQMIIYNFKSPCGPIAETEDVDNFMKIGQACLRRGDISAVCGTQVLLILLGADEGDGNMVAKRLNDTFEAHYLDATSRITYEIREING